MVMRRAASLAIIVMALQSVAPAMTPELNMIAAAAPSQATDVIAATAVRDVAGDPVGIEAYDEWTDAIKAGDMAAFMQFTEDETADMPEGLRLIAQTIREVSAGDIAAAQDIVEGGRTSESEAVIEFMDYLDAWLFAIAGEPNKAVNLHMSARGSLPGFTADLSLAALLEAVGREDEALAVYRALTPGEITAPEDRLDPQILLFGHVQTVIWRRADLLRRMGRVDDAIDVYRRLAEAEPEQAVRYAAHIEQLQTGRGLDNESLTPDSGFAQALFDISLVTWQARLIEASRQGRRLTGFDADKSSLDQIALLLVPEDEDYRAAVIAGLSREAFYEGAAHVALSGPDDTPDLLMSASRSLMALQDQDGARRSLDRAIELAYAEPDHEFFMLSNAARISMQLGDEAATLELAEHLLETAKNPLEEASANTTFAVVLGYLGRHDEALPYARAARQLDDTHDRRVFLATALGKVDQTEEGLRLLRTERLKRPNDPFALNSLGYFMIEHTDDYANGFLALARARTMTRVNPYIGDSVGWALYKLGHVDEGMRYIRQSRSELLPQVNWEVEDHYGDLLWLQGKTEEANEAWQLALTQYPPLDVKAKIEAKLAGEAEPVRYEKQIIPILRRDDEGDVASRDI